MQDENTKTWTVVLTVSQSVDADTAEEAERIARQALENSPSLWWVSVSDETVFIAREV